MMFHQLCWAAMLINAAGQQLFYSAAVQQIGLLLSSNLFLRPLLISNDVPPTLLGSNVDKCCWSAAFLFSCCPAALSSNLFLRPLLISNDVPPTLLGSNVDKCCWSASSFSIQLLSSSIEFGCYCQVTCPCAHC